jgi:hypothetical protein
VWFIALYSVPVSALCAFHVSNTTFTRFTRLGVFSEVGHKFTQPSIGSEPGAPVFAVLDRLGVVRLHVCFGVLAAHLGMYAGRQLADLFVNPLAIMGVHG